MQLVTILNKANQAYEDGFLSEYYDEHTGAAKDGDSGSLADSLARFIVAEIRETYVESSSDHDQIAEARRVLMRGISDLEAVCKKVGELER